MMRLRTGGGRRSGDRGLSKGAWGGSVAEDYTSGGIAGWRCGNGRSGRDVTRALEGRRLGRLGRIGVGVDGEGAWLSGGCGGGRRFRFKIKYLLFENVEAGVILG